MEIDSESVLWAHKRKQFAGETDETTFVHTLKDGEEFHVMHSKIRMEGHKLVWTRDREIHDQNALLKLTGNWSFYVEYLGGRLRLGNNVYKHWQTMWAQKEEYDHEGKKETQRRIP